MGSGSNRRELTPQERRLAHLRRRRHELVCLIDMLKDERDDDETTPAERQMIAALIGVMRRKLKRVDTEADEKASAQS